MISYLILRGLGINRRVCETFKKKRKMENPIVIQYILRGISFCFGMCFFYCLWRLVSMLGQRLSLVGISIWAVGFISSAVLCYYFMITSL